MEKCIICGKPKQMTISSTVPNDDVGPGLHFNGYALKPDEIKWFSVENVDVWSRKFFDNQPYCSLDCFWLDCLTWDLKKAGE